MKFLQKLPKSRSFAVLMGCFVVLPTLWAGLFMDDALARVKLLGVKSPWSPAPWWDLYTFARSDINPTLLAAGHHPWWADPSVKMTFFRPLAALTHHLDYLLWPHNFPLQHLHSLLWYGLAVFLVATIFQRLHGKGSIAAVVASLVFAVAPPHTLAVGWLAGRNTIMALVLACLLFLFHLQWRKKRGFFWLSIALVTLCVGFCTSEAILGGVAYIAAWQLTKDDAPRHSRWFALLPYIAAVVIWRVLYVKAGFGAAGTSIYRDPATDFFGAIESLVINFPVLLFGRWFPLPLDLWAILPSVGRIVFLIVVLLLLAGLLSLFWSLLQKNSTARFWALGMSLSLLPFTLTVPMDRLVLFAGPGMAGLVGLLAESLPQKARFRKVGVMLLWFHLPVAALIGILRASTLLLMLTPGTSGLAQAPKDHLVSSQTFVYVTGTFHRTHYTTLMRKAAGHPAVPKRAVVLSSMMTSTTIRRMDKHTLVVTPRGGYMLLELDRIHRRVTKPFRVGEVVLLPDVKITILRISKDGRPASVSFRFHLPLEARSLRWLYVQKQKSINPFAMKTTPFQLPKIGQTAQIPPAF
jgi:hypothetical protein